MKKAAPASTPTPAPSTATAVAAAAVAAPAPAPAPAAVAPPASTVKDAEFSVNGNDLQMKIRVLQARNLKGSKPDKINTMAKVQFADFVLKDSPVVSDSASPQYNFEQSLSLVVDEAIIGVLLNKKMTFTVVEQLPKDKSAVLGTAELALFPHFFRTAPAPVATADSAATPRSVNTVLRQWVPLVKPGESGATSEIEVEVNMSRPIIEADALEGGNMMTLKIEDMVNLPEEWSLKEGSDKDPHSNIYGYAVNFYVPLGAGQVKSICIANGVLTGTGEGDAQAKSVQWNQSVKCWLNPETVAAVRERIAKKAAAFHAEITRSVLPKFVGTVDPVTSKVRARMHVDGSPFATSKLMTLHVRLPVERFPAEAGEGQAALMLYLDKSRGSPNPDDFYKKLGTSVGIEINLEKPLQEKKKLQPITKNVSDFIPKREVPAYIRKQKNSKKATEQFQAQIERIVQILVKEYQKSINEYKSVPTPSGMSEELVRKKRFLFHLNRSGVYFTFKEELKSAVVEVARECFDKKSAFASQTELQTFLSEVYVFLVDQLHAKLNKMFEKGPAALDGVYPPQGADFDGLKRLADESEAEGVISLAITYHQQRIAMDEDNVQGWFDYGFFSMRMGAKDKAEECFKEVLSRNAQHIPTLLAYGLLCAIQDRHEQAHVLLKSAVDIRPKYVLSLTVLGIYYDFIDQESESEKVINEAIALHAANGANNSIYAASIDFLIKANVGPYAERALAHELLSSTYKLDSYLGLALLEAQQGKKDSAHEHLKKALELYPDDADARAAMANFHYTNKNWVEAKAAYESVVEMSTETKDMSQVYYRLGKIHLDSATGNAEAPLRAAKAMLIRACQYKPTASAWLGVGKACFRLQEYADAEDALTEANFLNNRDGEIWANIALLCLTVQRRFEANQALVQALKMGVRDAAVLESLAMLFLQAEDQRAAAECLRLTLELDPKNQTARDLFVAIVQPRQLEKDHDQFHLKSHTKLMTTMAQVKGSTQHHPHQQQRVVMSSSLAGETVAKVSERLSELTGTPGFADMVGAGKVKASKSRPATQQNSAGKSRKV